jgi:hypothetical protein
MSVVIELVGQQLEDQQGLLVYQVHDVADAVTARALVNGLAPAIWSSLIKQDVRIRERGGGVWEGDVPYGTLERPEAGSVSWSFEIGTHTLHITQALEHVHSYVASGVAPDHKGAIGVRHDGNGQSVEGVDIYVPVFTWEETHYFDAAVVATHSWIQTHESLVATINQAPFRVWGKGELLLLGVSGAKRADQAVPVTYRFASSKTKTNMTVGDITGISKEGHHYLWIEYEPVAQTSSKTLTSRPRAVHVERVYDYADWAANLPLPDPWS